MKVHAVLFMADKLSVCASGSGGGVSEDGVRDGLGCGGGLESGL